MVAHHYEHYSVLLLLEAYQVRRHREYVPGAWRMVAD